MILIPVYYQKGGPLLWAKIDDVDVVQTMHRWRPQRTSTGKFYAVRGRGLGRRRSMETIYLHREVLAAPDSVEVDHRNGDTLDCVRSNLRLADHHQNTCNVQRPSHNTSGFKGVSRSFNGSRWRAYIKIDGRQRFLGVFDTAEEAARTYDRVAMELFGEFARLNFPIGSAP